MVFLVRMIEPSDQLNTRRVAETALNQMRWNGARKALREEYKDMLRGHSQHHGHSWWEEVRRLLSPLTSLLGRTELHCLIELAGTGLSCYQLPAFLSSWARAVHTKVLEEEETNHQEVLHYVASYFCDDRQEKQEEEEEEDDRRLPVPLSLLAMAWPTLALGGLLRLALLRRDLLFRSGSGLSGLLEQPYLGCLDLEWSSLGQLHQTWLLHHRPHLLHVYPSMRAEQASPLLMFVQGQAIPQPPYTLDNLLDYVASFIHQMEAPRPRNLLLQGGDISLLRQHLGDIVHLIGRTSELDLDVRRRNFCFIALLGGVANTMQEAVSLAKHLAECEGCEPGDILCLLHTHFTDRGDGHQRQQQEVSPPPGHHAIQPAQACLPRGSPGRAGAVSPAPAGCLEGSPVSGIQQGLS